MTKFLSVLGKILITGERLLVGVAPSIGAAMPGAVGPMQVVVGDFHELFDIVVSVEAMGQALALPGAAKLTAAAPLVKQFILAHPILVGRHVQDWAAFNAGIDQLISGFVGIINSLKAEITTTDKGA